MHIRCVFTCHWIHKTSVTWIVIYYFIIVQCYHILYIQQNVYFLLISTNLPSKQTLHPLRSPCFLTDMSRTWNLEALKSHISCSVYVHSTRKYDLFDITLMHHEIVQIFKTNHFSFRCKSPKEKIYWNQNGHFNREVCYVNQQQCFLLI